MTGTDRGLMTPREIVSELDKYIVGQDEAVRAVARAVRRGRAGGEAGRELPEKRGEILYADHGAPVA